MDRRAGVTLLAAWLLAWAYSWEATCSVCLVDILVRRPQLSSRGGSAPSITQGAGYTWKLTPEQLDLGGRPDTLVDDQIIIKTWAPPGIREVSRHPMGTYIVMEWRDSHLKASEFQADITRFFAVGHVERYFLIHNATGRDTTIDKLVRQYAAAMHRDDSDTLVWPDLLPMDKAVLLAMAIHQKEYDREDLREGDRVLLLVPNIRFVGPATPGVF